MLSHTFVSALALLAVSGGAMAKPILWRASLSKRTGDQSSAPVSFNNYQGISTMSNFDNFNGASNFDGSSSQIIIKQDEVRVCKSVKVEIIQQQLAIIREWTKKIITEQICETEVQTVVLEQFSSGVSSFSGDVRRQNGKAPSYDKNIASMVNKIVPDSNGNSNASDLGFNGTSVGSNSVQVQGSNWNDSTSPNSTAAAYQLAQKASGKGANSTSSASSSSSSSAAASSTASSASASASGK